MDQNSSDGSPKVLIKIENVEECAGSSDIQAPVTLLYVFILKVLDDVF